MAAAPKKRVNQLAKELDITSKDITDWLEKNGAPGKTHSSALESDQEAQITAAFSKKTAAKPAAAAKITEKTKPAPEKAKPAAAKTKPERPADKSAPAVEPDAPKVATLLASRQQPRRPEKAGSSVEAPPVVKPVAAKSAAASTPEPTKKAPAEAAARYNAPPVKAQGGKSSSTAVQEPPTKIEPLLDEDDPVLEILKPPTEDEPYAEIAKSVERHQKVETTVHTNFKKTPEADKGEKPVAIALAKPHHHAAPVAEPAPTEVLPQGDVLKIEASLSISELAVRLKKRETELIRHLFMKGVMVTVNQTMQIEDAIALAKEMGIEAEGPDKTVVDFAAPELKIRQAKGNHLKLRAPVVSIMGHVDHGKTSLLDAIRESRNNIVDTEAGGITQSIGAYTVNKDNHRIVFIDTPGHEAFTLMRMRGAQATDIAILVVAADDGVMPQTIEAINHAKAANIPIIVAVNKIDKAGADPDKVLIQLAEHGLNAEKWGGETITVEVSALQKLGLDDLLEMIVLVSELQELKADSTVPAEGVVIEAKLDKGKGAVATLLVQNGTLHIGENILIGRVGGRVRALIDDLGERVKSVGPSTPVEILGLNEVPQAGDSFQIVRNDKEFKRLLQQAQINDKDQQRASQTAAPGLMGDKESKRQEFYLIIKGDTQGSIEAVSASILQLATEEVSIKILHSGTGDVSEADVLLASASNAIIIAFNVKEESNAQRSAQDQGIEVRSYDVIYHVTEDIEKMMLGRLTPETEEQETGVAEVRQLFSFGKTSIAGCYVTEGKIVRNSLSRVFRNNKEIFKGTLSNLKRFKDDAREVAAGYECGISFDKFNDVQPGDIIRAFTVKEIERTSL